MQDHKNLFMVLDFVEGGELFSHLRRQGRFPERQASFYAAQITMALEYAHPLITYSSRATVPVGLMCPCQYIVSSHQLSNDLFLTAHRMGPCTGTSRSST